MPRPTPEDEKERRDRMRLLHRLAQANQPARSNNSTTSSTSRIPYRHVPTHAASDAAGSMPAESHQSRLARIRAANQQRIAQEAAEGPGHAVRFGTAAHISPQHQQPASRPGQPYRHVPTHAREDAQALVKETKEEFNERIREANRERRKREEEEMRNPPLKDYGMGVPWGNKFAEYPGRYGQSERPMGGVAWVAAEDRHANIARPDMAVQKSEDHTPINRPRRGSKGIDDGMCPDWMRKAKTEKHQESNGEDMLRHKEYRHSVKKQQTENRIPLDPYPARKRSAESQRIYDHLISFRESRKTENEALNRERAQLGKWTPPDFDPSRIKRKVKPVVEPQAKPKVHFSAKPEFIGPEADAEVKIHRLHPSRASHKNSENSSSSAAPMLASLDRHPLGSALPPIPVEESSPIQKSPFQREAKRLNPAQAKCETTKAVDDESHGKPATPHNEREACDAPEVLHELTAHEVQQIDDRASSPACSTKSCRPPHVSTGCQSPCSTCSTADSNDSNDSNDSWVTVIRITDSPKPGLPLGLTEYYPDPMAGAEAETENLARFSELQPYYQLSAVVSTVAKPKSPGKFRTKGEEEEISEPKIVEAADPEAADWVFLPDSDGSGNECQ